jgi:alanyl-tRNA synthetase
MTSREIRQSFLDFFKSKGHEIVRSAPVVPADDPTLLFTNAGMNQFKDVFLGTGSRPYTRAANTQKCIRASGKHNDLEDVGKDTYHHTFFEMLGNWSFGDYYKKEAIAWAWELLTDVWQLPKDRLYATVFQDDDEAYELWKTVTDIDPSHIQKHGKKDNFWEMGETGPCGPCSEVHIDLTADKSGGRLVNAGSPQVIEIWNLVFIQFNRNSQGELEPLPAKHVDTGMGFERITAVLQGKTSNYDSDIFAPLLEKITELTGIAYGGRLESETDIAMRVLADHIRTLSFAIADGATPSNEGRGYVLRRILRRAVRYSRKLGQHEPVLYKLVATLSQTMGEVFPELVERRSAIEQIIRAEEENFLLTLDRGIEIFNEFAQKAKSSRVISGEDAFKLYDTYGFPLDLTRLMAQEIGLSVDEQGFEKQMQAQKERARQDRKKKVQSQEAGGAAWIQLSAGEDSRFRGYTHTDNTVERSGWCARLPDTCCASS